MYDGLELGTFYKENDKLKIKLHDNVETSWLPYIFELGLKNNTDMQVVFDEWIKDRVFPKNRMGSKKLLHELGLKKYNQHKIAEITRCSAMSDPYWVVYDENDTYAKNTIRGQAGFEEYPYNSLDIKNEEAYKWRIQ